MRVREGGGLTAAIAADHLVVVALLQAEAKLVRGFVLGAFDYREASYIAVLELNLVVRLVLFILLGDFLSNRVQNGTLLLLEFIRAHVLVRGYLLLHLVSCLRLL